MADPYAPYTAAPAANPYANWGQRVGAYLVDYGIFIVLDLIFFRSSSVRLIVALLALVWSAYNRWYLGGTTGQSLGKKALKLRLVHEETGQPIGPLMAFVRDICHIIDALICYIGFLFPLWDAKRQTIADKIVRTVVVPEA